jgi:hypothetical protein
MADMAIGEGQSEPPTLAGGTMSHDPTRDPIDELRRANPLRDDQLPASSRDRVWSRIQEARMVDTGQVRITQWTIAASGVALVGVLVAALTIGGAAPSQPPAGNNGSGGGATGMCIQFSLEELAARDFAFDGTVTAVNGDQATFTVNTAFWGVSRSEVTLTAAIGMIEESGVALDGGPLLVIGERYLISGDDTFAWTCGYSVVYDEATAAQWASLAP